MKSSQTNEVFERLETHLFIIQEKPQGFSVNWQPAILKALNLPRPKTYFNTVDQVRKNIETTLNARCTHNSTVEHVHTMAMQSYQSDLRITPTLHILNYLVGVI
jgi:hypothetical protein|uniref:Uncharacterized protein n=1 Tax=Acinetobacter phage vB_AbaSt_W16 TaxID=3116434 RepID=A0AB38ZCR9_9CAUD